MKRLILVAALSAATLLGDVYASPSKTSKKYHARLTCMALARVKHPITYQTEAAAQQAGKTPCGICYRTKKGGK